MCPPLRQLPDNSIATLATEDADAAVEYAKCQEKHGQVVTLYDKIRNEMIAYKEALAKKIEELNDE